MLFFGRRICVRAFVSFSFLSPVKWCRRADGSADTIFQLNLLTGE